MVGWTDSASRLKLRGGHFKITEAENVGTKLGCKSAGWNNLAHTPQATLSLWQIMLPPCNGKMPTSLLLCGVPTTAPCAQLLDLPTIVLMQLQTLNAQRTPTSAPESSLAHLQQLLEHAYRALYVRSGC